MTMTMTRWGASMVSLGGRLLMLGGGDGQVFLGSGEELVGGRWGPGLLFAPFRK